MKLSLLNNKKEKYQEEIFDIVLEEVKKIARIFHGNDNVKQVEFSFKEDNDGNVYFSDVGGVKIKGLANGEDVEVPISSIKEQDQDYILNVTGVLGFFVKNYPVDADDSITINQLGAECNLKNLLKNKSKLKF